MIEKVAKWMISKSLATGHGDAIEDMLDEAEWQIREREREACAKIAEEGYSLPASIATAIRARGAP